MGQKLYEEQEWRTQSCATRREGNKIWRRHSSHTLELPSLPRFCVFLRPQRPGGWVGGVGVWWGQPKLTSLQSSVDGISELSRRRQSAISWCSTRSPTLRSCVLHTSHSAAARRPLHHASCRRLSVSSTRRPSATSLPTSPPGSRCLTSHGSSPARLPREAERLSVYSASHGAGALAGTFKRTEHLVDPFHKSRLFSSRLYSLMNSQGHLDQHNQSFVGGPPMLVCLWQHV